MVKSSAVTRDGKCILGSDCGLGGLRGSVRKESCQTAKTTNMYVVFGRLSRRKTVVRRLGGRWVTSTRYSASYLRGNIHY